VNRMQTGLPWPLDCESSPRIVPFAMENARRRDAATPERFVDTVFTVDLRRVYIMCSSIDRRKREGL
jgi:hypothetical protein